MRETLKAVLHRRKRSTPTQSPRASYEQSEYGSPHTEQSPDSPRQRDRRRSSASQDASPRTSHDRKPNATHKNAIIGHSATAPLASVHNSLSNDTKSSRSVADKRIHTSTLAPSGDLAVESSDTSPSTSSRDTNGLNPPLPTSYSTSHNDGDAREEFLGRAVTTNGNLAKETQWDNTEDTLRRRSQSSERDKHDHEDMAVKSADFDSSDGYHNIFGGDEWKSKRESMLKGVVDLSNTVDTDRETSWAPAVTHEIVKPHEHEIVQHKIYREIHNYTYYHRLQPVMQTEVLPPRHFIPNPDGEGLIEISADELPSRTGKNRWWDIVQKEPVLPEAPFQWRTEPQIIEGKPYMTDEGFERRETTIIYPPTLEDMSNYDGMIQPVHFDHKTGRRWLGDITTVDKLKRELDGKDDEDFMKMKDITANLPEMPESPLVKRKPLDRDSL